MKPPTLINKFTNHTFCNWVDTIFYTINNDTENVIYFYIKWAAASVENSNICDNMNIYEYLHTHPESWNWLLMDLTNSDIEFTKTYIPFAFYMNYLEKYKVNYSLLQQFPENVKSFYFNYIKSDIECISETFPVHEDPELPDLK